MSKGMFVKVSTEPRKNSVLTKMLEKTKTNKRKQKQTLIA